VNMARSALRRADPATASVAEIARLHQFPEPGRFAVTYRTIFGEMPSSTVRRSLTKTPYSKHCCRNGIARAEQSAEPYQIWPLLTPLTKPLLGDSTN
jgi:hypothetical protein